MTDDPIATRIAKLLALADRAGTPDEAANALGHAQRLAETHGISAQRIALAEAHRNGAPVADEPIVTGIIMTLATKVAPRWLGHIAIAVAECNRGAVRYGRVGATQGARGWNGSITIIAHGTASDIAVMAAVLPAITHQVERLCNEWTAADEAAARSSRSARDSYRKGVAATVCRRLREAVAEARKALEDEATAAPPVFALPTAGSGGAAAAESTALVMVRDAIATLDQRGKDAVQAMHVAAGRPKAQKAYRRSTATVSDGAAHRDGQRDGQRDGHRVALGGRKAIGQ